MSSFLICVHYVYRSMSIKLNHTYVIFSLGILLFQSSIAQERGAVAVPKRKPDLYIFAMSVSDYRSGHNLEYARKDGVRTL